MEVSFRSNSAVMNTTAKQTKSKTSSTIGVDNSAQSVAKYNYSPACCLINKAQVSFKGSFSKEEVEKKKLEIEERNKKLREDLEFAKTFNYWDAKEKYDKQAEEERKGVSVWAWGRRRSINEKYKNKLEQDEQRAEDILNKKDLIEQILAGNDVDIGVLKDDLEKIEKSHKLIETEEAMKKAKGGMDDRIAGYEPEKKILEAMFIKPISREREGYDAYVPPAVILYGATGTGKTTFIDALAYQTGCAVVPVETTSGEFAGNVREKLDKARERYLDGQKKNPKEIKRTFLLINEAEEFLNTDEKNKENVRLFKSILDKCSELPKDEEDTARSATTILMTTNSPHLIHPHIRNRKGKIGDLIAINPAEKPDIEAVLRHYVEKVEETAKAMNEKEGTKKYIISHKSIPYDKIAEFNQPSMEKGAYSNDKLRDIVNIAFNKYSTDPQNAFSTHLGKTFINEKRDIEPEQFKEFVRIYKMIAPPEIGELERLEAEEQMGTLSEKEAEKLRYIREMNQAEDIEDIKKRSDLNGNN